MAKIVRDATGKHWYHLGVSWGTLYPMKDDGTYDKGVAWDGIISVDNNPDGAEPNELWADDIKYAVLYSAETLGLTIECYQYPDEFATCNGMVEVSDGVFLRQQPRNAFGFAYRTKVGNDTGTKSDDGYLIHVVYGCTAQPSSESYETINDNPDAITFSFDIDTIAAPVTGHEPVSEIVFDSRTLGATKMATLEAKLFGSETTEPTLPTPDELIALFAA